MIFDYLKSKVSKKDDTKKVSKYLPKTFMLGKPFEIDPSFKVMIKNSAITLPNNLTPTEFKDWRINDIDDFEEIVTNDKSYRFLYDQTNDALYLLQLADVSSREDIKNDSVHVRNNIYEAATEILEIPSQNELIRVYTRELNNSNEDAEYLFIYVDKNMLQKCWIGVIIETSLIN